MKELLKMFFIFAKIGGFTFGGGYAMLPILQHEIVEKRQWATEEELMDYYAIGQCTPGIIAVNTATFIGHKRHGLIGGIICTLGVVFPSVVIITLVSAFINNFTDILWVQNILSGIRACVCVLIFNAVLKLGAKALTSPSSWVIFGAVFILSLIFGISNILLVVLSAAAGIIVGIIKERRKK